MKFPRILAHLAFAGAHTSNCAVGVVRARASRRLTQNLHSRAMLEVSGSSAGDVGSIQLVWRGPYPRATRTERSTRGANHSTVLGCWGLREELAALVPISRAVRPLAATVHRPNAGRCFHSRHISNTASIAA